MFLRCTFVIKTMKITALQYFYLALNNYDIISERYVFISPNRAARSHHGKC